MLYRVFFATLSGMDRNLQERFFLLHGIAYRVAKNNWLVTAGGDFHGDVGVLGELELEKDQWNGFLDKVNLNTD